MDVAVETATHNPKPIAVHNPKPTATHALSDLVREFVTVFAAGDDNRHCPGDSRELARARIRYDRHVQAGRIPRHRSIVLQDKAATAAADLPSHLDRKSTRLNS